MTGVLALDAGDGRDGDKDKDTARGRGRSKTVDAKHRATSAGRRPSKTLVATSTSSTRTGRPGTSCFASVSGAVSFVRCGSTGGPPASFLFWRARLLRASVGGSGGTGGTGWLDERLGEDSEVCEELEGARRGAMTGMGRQKTSGRLRVWMSGCRSRKRTRSVLNDVETVVRPERDSSSSLGKDGASTGGSGEGHGLGEGHGDGMGVARGDFRGEAVEGRKCSINEGGGWTRESVLRCWRRAMTRGRTCSSGEADIETMGARRGMLRCCEEMELVGESVAAGDPGLHVQRSDLTSAARCSLSYREAKRSLRQLLSSRAPNSVKSDSFSGRSFVSMCSYKAERAYGVNARFARARAGRSESTQYEAVCLIACTSDGRGMVATAGEGGGLGNFKQMLPTVASSQVTSSSSRPSVDLDSR